MSVGQRYHFSQTHGRCTVEKVKKSFSVPEISGVEVKGNVGRVGPTCTCSEKKDLYL